MIKVNRDLLVWSVGVLSVQVRFIEFGKEEAEFINEIIDLIREEIKSVNDELIEIDDEVFHSLHMILKSISFDYTNKENRLPMTQILFKFSRIETKMKFSH